MLSNPKQSDLTGHRVGEYEITARLGAGGMGIVYEGRQPLIGKRVAVKVLLPQLTSEPELVERFLSEARAVNSIRHRGIVDIFSFGQLEDGAQYFVMEFLDGLAFDKVLRQKGPQPPYQVLGWCAEVLDALDAAHLAGIIHRDIKPSNLYLVDAGRGNQYVKLLDFGIAKSGALPGQATPQTRADVIIGTPDYMAPEQVRGEPISPQTDLYAMGCVMFELMTGRRPFRGVNSMQTMFQHIEASPPRVSEFVPSVASEVDDLVLWAMQKDSSARPSSAGDYRLRVEGVRHLLRHEPTHALPLPPSRASLTPPPSGSSSMPSRFGSRRSVSPPEELTFVDTPLPNFTTSPAQGANSLAPLPAVTREQLQIGDLDSELLGSLTQQRPEPDLPLPADTRVTNAPVAPQPRRRMGNVGVLVAVLAVCGVGGGAGLWLMQARATPAVTAPQPAAVVDAPPPSPPQPDHLGVENAAPPRPLETTEGGLTEGVVPVKRVKKPAPTDQELAARLETLDQRLTANEARTGGRDRVLRQFLDQARQDAKAAKTSQDRREVFRELNDLQNQLDAP